MQTPASLSMTLLSSSTNITTDQKFTGHLMPIQREKKNTRLEVGCHCQAKSQGQDGKWETQTCKYHTPKEEEKH